MFIECIFIVCFALHASVAFESSETERRIVQVEAENKLYLTCHDANITCKMLSVQERPESVLWFLNGTNITQTNDRFMKESKDCKPNYCSFLRLKCVSQSDVGNYTCSIQTDEGTYDSLNSFWLDVHEPIKVVNRSLKHRVPLNPSGETNLMCVFEGQNIRNVSWSKMDNLDVIWLPTSHHKEEKLGETRIKSVLTIKGIGRDKNGTYLCGASDDKMTITENVPLYVLDKPQITLHTITATGSQQVFMNWTIDDGNSPIDHYIVQYRKNGTDNWQFYGSSISGLNTSCIIRKLEPNMTYTFLIKARNEMGEQGSNESHPVTTLTTDPSFVPEVSIRGAAPNSINIGWSYPPDELRNHVHYFKLLMTRNDLRKEAVVNANSDLFYLFTNLQSATTYYFQVAACNEYTKECGNWSAVNNGTTLDGVASAPENVSMTCKYDNISNTGTVWTSWSPPKIPNGEIVHYIATILGNASFMNEFGKNDVITYGPKTKTIKNDTHNASFPQLPPNTNYTITISAVTRRRDAGEVASKHCVMPPTVPDRENLQKFDWDKVDDKGAYYFRLLKPRLSERNGAICCFRVFVVKLKPQQSIQQLPSPEQNPVFSYSYVHREASGGAYMAEIFDKDFETREIYVGDAHLANSTTKCSKCPTAIKMAPMPAFTTTTAATSSTLASSTTNASPTEIAASSDQQPNPAHYASAELHADASILSSDPSNALKTAATETGDEVLPFDGPLHEGSNYTGYIQLIVFGKEGFIPAYSSYFKILKPGPSPLSDAQANGFSSILFQILCCMIAISIMMLAAFCLLQHYTKQVAEAQGVEMTLRNSFRHLCRSLRGSHVPVSSNPPDVLPISKTALQTTFAELAKDSDYGFEQEFEMLPDRFTDRTTKASEARENTTKNRYPDIKAYDQTRVKLSQVDGIVGSDYINANFVMSYKERKKFICAQGPMENTVCDFWRMIWEQHLELVLMLTNLEEYSKTKCAKYWPDKEEETKTFNDITIHYVNEKRYSDYVVRELKMVRTTGQANRDPEERTIFQYHFLMWRDFQAPEHPSGILKFIWRVNEAYSLEKGPILVHCSAGVGRTGTLVAIDSLLQQLDNEGQVLIFNTICDLRHQRNFLVQSLKQYIFVYRALVEYAHFGNTEIRANSLKSTFEKLKRSENGRVKTRLEEEYDKLTFVINAHDLKKSTSVGGAPENDSKNRPAKLIPYDKNRVILTPIPGRDNSTYINASFIEGYDNSESFVITQDPIIDVTVVDFWRMISELNITTLVMLSSTTSPDGQKKSGRYWPDDEAVYGNVNVKHIQSESCPYYTRREFYVNNVKSDENLVLTQFQYNGWPTVEGEVPEVTRGLIELMDHATTLNENTNSASPIVVHCEQGGDRSSMFVALCILAQQLKVERRVDVVTTTRKLRSQRMGMLTSFAQYECLYRAMLNYVDLHHLFEAESN